MDNHDRRNFDATDAYAPPSSPFPEADPLFSRRPLHREGAPASSLAAC